MSVFDRLYNPDSYTGSAAARFKDTNRNRNRVTNTPMRQPTRSAGDIAPVGAKMDGPTRTPSVPPARHGNTKPEDSTQSIYERLNNPANFTGASRNRFDSNGKGRGKAGWDSGEIHSFEDVLRQNQRKSTMVGGGSSDRIADERKETSDMIVASHRPRSVSIPKQNSDIYERLNDPSGFTGTHQHRFDEEGKGRGIEGHRDDERRRELGEILYRARSGGSIVAGSTSRVAEERERSTQEKMSVETLMNNLEI